MGKVIIHPAARRVIVKRIMDEVRAIKSLRAIAKELKGCALYSPEIAEAVLRMKRSKLDKVN